MGDWDSVAMLLVGLSVGWLTGREGLRWWRRGNRLGACGAFLLAVLVTLFPLVGSLMRE